MFKNTSLSAKLLTGFIVVAIVTAVVGFIGYQGMINVNKFYHQAVDESIPAIMYIMAAYADFLEIYSFMYSFMNPGTKFEEYPVFFERIAEEREEYAEGLANYSEFKHEKKEQELYDNLVKAVANAKEVNNNFLEYAKNFLNPNADKNAIIAELNRIRDTQNQKELMDNALDSVQYLAEYVASYYGDTLQKENAKKVNSFISLTIATAVIGFILAFILGLIFGPSISKPVTALSGDLFTATKNLESASKQVSSSSQQLSSGASELASSIEEMTSSLEELQSIIEANTKNINQSEIMMQESTAGSKEVNKQISNLQEALVEINDNSKKISRIIKVIDDIAFQTNILALNAAVEAARAGDAGRGFAVVAEQVKSLAQKSAEAAKETAILIEQAIASVGKGENLGNLVVNSQQLSLEQLTKVATILDEVNRASKEQLKGANQITQAINQVNAVVEQTSANSEENAAAGEELFSQAETLGEVVNKLNIIVHGDARAYKINREIERKAEKKQYQDKYLSKAISANPKTPIARKSDNFKVKEMQLANDKDVEIVRPEDKIPLNDFKDF